MFSSSYVPMQSVAMATTSNSLCFLLLLLFFASPLLLSLANAQYSPWISAQATLYGGDSTGTINGGACGYGDLYSNGYGTNTAAISTALFNNGASCGACFEIKCDESSSNRCLSVGKSVTITATNFCPPNHQLTSGLCNPPSKHFDISEPAFQEIATYSSGEALPVKYKRVPCSRQGGMHFTVNGNSHMMLVLLTNVGGSGEVESVYVKGSRTGWQPMARNWGSNWQTEANLRGQSLSFQVLLADGSTVTSYGAAPSDWQFGQTFEGTQAP